MSVHPLLQVRTNECWFTYICQYFQTGIKGSARFNLFGSTVVENTTVESQNTVTVDFKWSHVESILEIPPLSSTATLVSHNHLYKILKSCLILFFFLFLTNAYMVYCCPCAEYQSFQWRHEKSNV